MRFKKNIFIVLSLFLFFGTVKAQNICDFSYSIDYEVSDLTIEFQNQSINSQQITNYSWQFGDEETSEKENPQHQYLNYGNYIVILKITLANGNTLSHTDTLNLDRLYYGLCDAFFSYTTIQQQIYTVQFFDHSIPGSNDTLNSWLWDFGDGNQSTQQNPIHQFSSTGTYTVSLTITTTNGCSSTEFQQVLISSGGPQCEANFSSNADTSNTKKIYFHDLSTSDDNIVSWTWYFDDGDSSNLQDPTHLFQFEGYYDVKLKIVTSTNCTSVITKRVQVGNPQAYNMWGRVYAGNYIIDKCIAYLYKKFNNGYYKAIDTVNLTSVNDTLGVYYFYQKYEGDYVVKLILPDNSSFSDFYAPTYYGDNLLWNNASSLNLFSDISLANIDLKPVNKPNSNSQINGYVNNSSNTDYSIANVELLLLDPFWNIIDYTFSDNNGYFHFDNIAQGNYYVLGEITGLFGQAINVGLANSDTINNITIYIRQNSVTSLHEIDEKDLINSVKIGPNPANDYIEINFNDNSALFSNIIIYDINGKVVKNISIPNKYVKIYKFNISGLSSGTYIIKGITKNNNFFTLEKLIKF